MEKRITIFFLSLFLYTHIFSGESSYKRHIAVLIKTDFIGEIFLTRRIEAACESLNWKVDIVLIEKAKKLRKNKYDFVINLVPGIYKHPKCNNYLAVFHPAHYYFNDGGSLKEEYRSYDGYLLTYNPGEYDTNFGKLGTFPYIKWYPTVQNQKYKEVNPLCLFHIPSAWGNRFFNDKFKEFLQLLDKEPYTRMYGREFFQSLYPRSYQCKIPFSSYHLLQIAAQAGVSLVLHSDEHNAYGQPSGRIFEAAAASTVIICDENDYIKEHFKDSVLYINTDESADSIHGQIQQHMHWIKSHKKEALQMSKRSHEIFKEKFLLEEQLLRLEEFHNQQLLKSKYRFWSWIKKIPSFFLSLVPACSQAFTMDPTPVAVVSNPDPFYTLINSIDFHPKERLFCGTYTHNNKLIFYQVDECNQPHVVQSLQNPHAQLSEPQHAIFSPDGTKIVVANWTNQTLTIYQ